MLDILNIYVEVEGKEVLKDIDLAIPDHEVHALFGSNGSGKNVLINSVEDFIKSQEYSMNYQIDLMTDTEREYFLNLENQGCRGCSLNKLFFCEEIFNNFDECINIYLDLFHREDWECL